ncbi:hypothetical protein CGMCC3_g2053 [Colletotrichum fructicola]|nr:uncharacterized protein CGMCC3_g2053 [Colletotrichum fructicola]KAE9582009.1 hypothetical protein CGMCC3_g2053 [Colletotrichum fructicola]
MYHCQTVPPAATCRWPVSNPQIAAAASGASGKQVPVHCTDLRRAASVLHCDSGATNLPSY